MKLLYCNLLKKSAIEGHKHFDMEWVSMLSTIANVTVLCPEDKWYPSINSNVATAISYVDLEMEKRRFLKWKIWKKEPLKHLAMFERMEATIQIKKALELDKKECFDYIIVSTVDLIAFLPYYYRFSNHQRLFFIAHNAEGYKSKLIAPIFSHIKNRVNHIVMEQNGRDYMIKHYSLDSRLVHYIPHMLNVANIQAINSNIEPKDIIGISNSNNDFEVQKIIDLEERDGFFEKNKLTALFRSTNIEYKSKYLTVFAGRLGLSYDDYITYYKKARVVILPFSEDFGIRSSGTIMDAFSQKIPIIGNRFGTMLQYNKKYPHICRLYSNMDEFQYQLLSCLNNSQENEEEFAEFQEEHSREFILNCFKELFV